VHTVPPFKGWSTKLLKHREKEEIVVGFGHLPIVEGLQLIETTKKKLKKKKEIKDTAIMYSYI
jgi:hypothetical protein